MTIGTMFVWVFFENLGKGGYTPTGYAGVINYYIKSSHSPAAWKLVLGFMSSHAAMIAPGQAAMELSLGILLVIGLLTRPAPWWHSCSSAAFGSRNWHVMDLELLVRCSHRSDSRWDAQVVPGASTRCWHGGAPRPRVVMSESERASVIIMVE